MRDTDISGYHSEYGFDEASLCTAQFPMSLSHRGAAPGVGDCRRSNVAGVPCDTARPRCKGLGWGIIARVVYARCFESTRSRDRINV